MTFDKFESEPPVTLSLTIPLRTSWGTFDEDIASLAKIKLYVYARFVEFTIQVEGAWCNQSVFTCVSMGNNYTERVVSQNVSKHGFHNFGQW